MRRLFQKTKPKTRRQLVAEKQAAEEIVVDSSIAYKRNSSRSTHRETIIERSERSRFRDQLHKRRVLALWMGGFVGLILIVVFFTTQLTILVKVQTSASQSRQFAGEYKAALDEYLSQRPIERLRLLVDEGSLNEFMIEHHPEIRSVRLVGSGQAFESSLQLSFRQPVAQWTSTSGKAYVDAQGATFSRSFFQEPEIIVIDESGTEAYQGQELSNQRFLSFLGQAIAHFETNGLSVSQVKLPQDSARLVEVSLVNRSFPIRMTVDRTAKAQAEQAIIAINHFDNQGRTPQYLDVRVDQQVYYK